MYSVSLKDLINRVRQRANLEGATAFLTDPEVTDNINQSLTEWYDEVRGCTWGGQYYRSSTTFATVPTTTPPYKVQLPPDFLSMTSVDVALSSNNIICARPFQEEQRNNFYGIYPGWSSGWSGNAPLYYQLWGNYIVFNPLPNSTYQVTLNYVPTAPRLSTPTSSFDSINGFEEFIVLDASIKCLIKMGEPGMLTFLQGRLEQQRERIRAMAPRRDMSQAENVHQISTDNVDAWDWF